MAMVKTARGILWTAPSFIIMSGCLALSFFSAFLVLGYFEYVIRSCPSRAAWIGHVEKNADSTQFIVEYQIAASGGRLGNTTSCIMKPDEIYSIRPPIPIEGGPYIGSSCHPGEFTFGKSSVVIVYWTRMAFITLIITLFFGFSVFFLFGWRVIAVHEGFDLASTVENQPVDKLLEEIELGDINSVKNQEEIENERALAPIFEVLQDNIEQEVNSDDGKQPHIATMYENLEKAPSHAIAWAFLARSGLLRDFFIALTCLFIFCGPFASIFIFSAVPEGSTKSEFCDLAEGVRIATIMNVTYYVPPLPGVYIRFDLSDQSSHDFGKYLVTLSHIQLIKLPPLDTGRRLEAYQCLFYPDAANLVHPTIEHAPSDGIGIVGIIIAGICSGGCFLCMLLIILQLIYEIFLKKLVGVLLTTGSLMDPSK